jgi:hypothetical protein
VGVGGDVETADSEELRLAESLDSPIPSFITEEIVLRIPGAVEDDRFLAGTLGISFPGNSCRN